MKVSANLSLLFTELPLIERIGAAAEAGFDGVEIQFPYELPAGELKAALDQAGLPLVLINLPAGDLMQGGAGLAAVPAQQDAFDAALRHAYTYAALVQPQCLNVLPGRLANGVSRPEALATLVANLRKAADTFHPLGIQVLAEAINPFDMPGFLINTPEQLLELVRSVESPNFAAQLDLYHLARQQLDPVAAIRLLGDAIGHVQFADHPGRGAPGSGELDFAPALAALTEVGYAGWLGAEYRPGGPTRDGLDWLPRFKAA